MVLWQSPDIPELVVELIDRGLWPANRAQARDLTFDISVVQSVAVAEREIRLQPPPFRVLAGLNDAWFGRFRHAGELDYERALVLGDFGIGSDNPIVLDTTSTPNRVKALEFATMPNPNQGRSEWPDGARFSIEGHWIVLAPTIED